MNFSVKVGECFKQYTLMMSKFFLNMEFLAYNFLKLLVILFFFINFVVLQRVLNDTNHFSLAYVYPKLYHGVSGHSQHGQSIIEAIVFCH